MTGKRVFFLLYVFFFTVSIPSLMLADDGGMRGPVSRLFAEWLEMKQRGDDMSRFCGAVPSPTDLGPLPKVRTALKVAPSLPAKYDPRESGKLVPVRDQGSDGTCWAHAALATAEIGVMKNEGRVIDFSESHLANNNGYDYDGWSIGNADMAQGYMLRWQGPVLEAYEPYPSKGASVTAAPARHIQRVCHVAAKSSALDNDAIKEAVLKYGALSVAYYDSYSYYSSAHHAYYCPYKHDTSHLVALVGWDDSYPKENFSIPPPGNGAYIVRNSWGSGWGENGYYYVSYYDSVFAYYRMYSFVADEYPDNYGRVYQHDTYGYSGTWGFNSTIGWGASIFKAAGNEKIVAVGFYALSPGTSYTIRMYEGCSASNPSSGSLKLEQTGRFDDAGYFTVKLDSAVSVTMDSFFSVVIKVNSPGLSYPLAVEWHEDGYTSRVSASSGETFRSSNGSSWYDFFDNNCHFCVKAYTESAGQPQATAGEVHVPKAWIDDYPEVLSSCGGDYNRAASCLMPNGQNLAESYVAMLDPLDVNSKLITFISVSNGVPSITWQPCCMDRRSYKIEGKTSLNANEQWSPASAGHHYFRVSVDMP